MELKPVKLHGKPGVRMGEILRHVLKIDIYFKIGTYIDFISY